jgi:hypothetical protein
VGPLVHGEPEAWKSRLQEARLAVLIIELWRQPRPRQLSIKNLAGSLFGFISGIGKAKQRYVRM